MGLDSVEIVMAVEKAFDMPLTDDEVTNVRTPGHLIDLVMAKVSHADATVCLTQRAFYQMRRWFMERLSLKRSDITLATPISELVPKTNRNSFMQQFAADLGTGTLPPLVRPTWLVSLLFGFVILVCLTAAVAIISRPFGLWLLPMIAIVILACWLCTFATRPFRTEFPPDIRMVSDLSRWVMRHKPDLAVPSQRTLTRKQIASRVRQIVVDILGCEQHYREDARFVEDLGMY